MRIAVVTAHPPGLGSLNEYGYHFVRALRQKPEVSEVLLLAADLPNGDTYPACPGQPGLAPMRTVPCWRFGAWDNPTRILGAVRAEQPDAVVFNIQFASFSNQKVPAVLGLMAAPLIKAAGFPTVVLLHNLIETTDLHEAGFARAPVQEWLIRTFGSLVTRQLLRVDWLAVTIPKYVEILENKYRANNALLAPHGAFEVDDVSEEPPAEGPRRIMTFGKFGTYKRVELLIEAYQLVQRTVEWPVELVIAGTDNPNVPGYLAEIKRVYADVQGLRFTGYVPEPDVPALFHESTVVVLPYMSTMGSSGVLHQAAGYRRPVVFPRIGDFAELIKEEGFDAEFFEPGDPLSMANAIRRLLECPERRLELTRNNYLAAKGLGMAEVVDWYVVHIEQLLKAREKSA